MSTVASSSSIVNIVDQEHSKLPKNNKLQYPFNRWEDARPARILNSNSYLFYSLVQAILLDVYLLYTYLASSHRLKG